MGAFDPDPVQLKLRGDAYLWRELRAQFVTTALPSDWYELRQLIADAAGASWGTAASHGNL